MTAIAVSFGESSWRRLAPWLIALVAAVVYANALQNGFALDDVQLIPKHRVINHLEPAWNAFTTPYWPTGAGQYRPLVILSYTVDSWLWGTAPSGYHAVNMLLHALASVLAYALARRWLSFGGSAIAALLFAVHPVHVEAVANVVGRAEIMAACGALAALLLHERRSPWAVVAFAFALFSKEHALITPVLAAAWDLARYEKRPPGEPGQPRAPHKRPLALYTGYAIVAVVWGGAVYAVFRDAPVAVVDPLWTSIDAKARWLTMLGVVPVWARLFFFPADLSIDYSPRATLPWPDNFALAVLGGLIVVVAVAAAFASGRRQRAITAAIVWIALTMLPVSNLVVPTGIIVAERTLYLSSVGAVLLLGLAAERIARWRPEAALTFAVAIVALFTVRTWTRTPIWHSNRVLLLRSAEAHPEGAWTHTMLARVFLAAGNEAQGNAEYRRSLTLFDRNRLVWSDAIHAAVVQREFRLADSLVSEARRRFERDYMIDVAHATVALAHGRFEEALGAAREAVRAEPDSAAGHMVAAGAWMGLGQPDSAVAWFGRVPVGHPMRARADSLRARFGSGR